MSEKPARTLSSCTELERKKKKVGATIIASRHLKNQDSRKKGRSGNIICCTTLHIEAFAYLYTTYVTKTKSTKSGSKHDKNQIRALGRLGAVQTKIEDQVLSVRTKPYQDPKISSETMNVYAQFKSSSVQEWM